MLPQRARGKWAEGKGPWHGGEQWVLGMQTRIQVPVLLLRDSVTLSKSGDLLSLCVLIGELGHLARHPHPAVTCLTGLF